MKNQRGFTMIEILMVVAVIGLILGVTVPNVANIRKRSRDERAVAHIGLIEQALAQYRQKCKTYPMHTNNEKLNLDANTGITGVNSGTCPGGTKLSTFLPQETIEFITDHEIDISYVALSRVTQEEFKRCSTYFLAYSLESGFSSAKQANRASLSESLSGIGFFKCGSFQEKFYLPDPIPENWYIAPIPSPY